MKEYVDEYRFRDRFLQSSNYKNNFSYEGLTALFEYIEELEDDCDEEILRYPIQNDSLQESFNADIFTISRLCRLC